MLHCIVMNKKEYDNPNLFYIQVLQPINYKANQQNP